MSRKDGELRACLAKEARVIDLSKTPVVLKVLGALCIVAGLSIITEVAFVARAILRAVKNGAFAGEYTLVTQVFVVLASLLATASVLLLVFMGVRLILNNRRKARRVAEGLIAINIGLVLCLIMLFGMSEYLIVPGIILIAEIALLSYIDPSLSDERELQRKLRMMETRTDVEEGTLGRDETGKGYIKLDFFNLFWIFVVCCFLGIIIETVYIFVLDGFYQNRTGMLWGPFSPIYGFGAVLMTIALNRFHDRNLLIIFLVSAVIGGSFEFAVSWFLEVAFGVTAWDYTGTFLSIGGRTNGFYMCMWGILGMFWIKVCLPRMLKLVNRIPWKWRYSITSIAAAFMIFNGVMTLVALDCWTERLAGMEPDGAVTRYCAEHFDDEWMANHFQTMSIDPNSSARVQ